MWHLSQFRKRLELLIKPSGFGYNAYNQRVLVKIPNQIILYLTNYYDIGFVDIEGNTLYYSSKKFSPGTNEVEYYVKAKSIDDLNYTSLFVYYDFIDASISGGFKVYVYRRIHSLPHPPDHVSLVDVYDVSNTIYNSYVINEVYLTESMDYYCYFVIGQFYVSSSNVGTWTFAVDGDGAVEVEIDGSVVASWYGDHSICNCYTYNGSIHLNSGWHKFIARQEERTGGDALRVHVKRPADSYWNRMGTSVTSCRYNNYSDSIIYDRDFIANSAISDSYIVNYLNTLTLVSEIGPNFVNHGAMLYQPICDTYAVRTSAGSSYVSCSISKSMFTLFFNCYFVSDPGHLVYFSSSNYVYINSNGSLLAKINSIEYNVGSKLYTGVCSTFSITCDGEQTYVIINGLTKLLIKQTFSISEIRLGGNGSSGHSCNCYFFDLFLLSSKLPLYSYYLHNTRYDSSNFFRESGYDNLTTNGYLTHWPGVLFVGDEAIFRANVEPSVDWKYYSVSFDGGSSWYASNLDYDDLFTKHFGSVGYFPALLKLESNTETLNKEYLIVVSDPSTFSMDVPVNFSAGSKKDGYEDVVSDFLVKLHDKYGTEATPVEYTYETSMSGLKLLYLERPTEFVWGGTLGSGILSKTVEFCFENTLTYWFDDIYIDFWLGELYEEYHIDMITYFSVGSAVYLYKDVDVDFVLSNWKYFPNETNIVCSVIGYTDSEVEINMEDGRVIRTLSDITASKEELGSYCSSVFCSVSGISSSCYSDIQTISGTVSRHDTNIYCSLLDVSGYCSEIKLNTIVIENFNLRQYDVDVSDGNFCFNVDVYDRYYGVTESGVSVYMNTDTLVGNMVSNLSFTTISGGNTVSWCYDVGSLCPVEYVEVIVNVVNTYGDVNKASYFLRYGKRYYYNLYHILRHDYDKLIPMLIAAENNINIFPSFSTETMYVNIEDYKQRDLQASISCIGLSKDDLGAEIKPITTNFYTGGDYTVRVECKDLAGNVMDPLEFDFVIRSDGL